MKSEREDLRRDREMEGVVPACASLVHLSSVSARPQLCQEDHV